MGNDGAGVLEGLPSSVTIKVHVRMCSELLNLVAVVSKIIPEIEAARPRDSGIESLCLLCNGIAKAKSLLRQCSESSILYLALAGDGILSKCKKCRNLFEHCLSRIQNTVPVMLAAKISRIILALRRASFHLDPPEEEAGKVLRDLLHRYGSTVDSTQDFAISAIHAVCSLLHISSRKALVIEKQSIRKLLDKVGEGKRIERKILCLFLSLLNKHRMIATERQKDDGSAEHEDNLPFASPYNLSVKVKQHVNCSRGEAQTSMLSMPVPPKEFVCPLSSRLMHDPVVIASGQTYERMSIQKWFDDGHDTCPETNMKLDHLSFTENAGLKDQILEWCARHSFSNPDAKIQEPEVKSWENSTNSIVSLGSSMNNLNLPSDFSNISLGSSQGSDLSCTNIVNNVNPSCEICALPLDSSCNTVKNVRRLLKISDESWSMMPFGKFIQRLLRFLKDAHDLHDVEAQVTGCLYLLELVQKHRNTISYVEEDAYGLLASFLDTDVAKQALSILEVLSFHQQCGHKIAASGALVGILNILKGQVQELLEPALNILNNLSADSDVASFIMPSDFIPQLLPLLESSTLARYGITILKNLCDKGETDGCITSIAELLENGSHVEQEHAVSILLSMCSLQVQYRQLVMDERLISGLFHISINGNKKAKAAAIELMQILEGKSSTTGESSVSNVIVASTRKQNDNS